MGPPIPTASHLAFYTSHTPRGVPKGITQDTSEAAVGAEGQWRHREVGHEDLAAWPSRSGLLWMALPPRPCGHLQSWAASLWRTALGSCCSRLLVCKNYLFLFPTVKFFIVEVTCACGVFMVQKCLQWYVKSFQALPAVKTVSAHSAGAGPLVSPDPFRPVAPSFLRSALPRAPSRTSPQAETTLPTQVVLEYLLIFRGAGYLPVFF